MYEIFKTERFFSIYNKLKPKLFLKVINYHNSCGYRSYTN